MYFEYATRIPEVIRWLIRHPSCQSPDLGALCAAIPGGLKSFLFLLFLVPSAFTPRGAHSKGPTTPGGRTFRHSIHHLSTRNTIGGTTLPHCSSFSAL